MFLNNKTMDWLNRKEENERNALIQAASNKLSKYKKTYKSRLQEINDRKREKLQERIRVKEQQEREKLRKMTEYTNGIMRHGLWQSEEEVDNMLSSYGENQKKDVLKAQLRFREDVLHQMPDDKKTFNFTKAVEGKKARKNLSVEELTDNLKS